MIDSKQTYHDAPSPIGQSGQVLAGLSSCDFEAIFRSAVLLGQMQSVGQAQSRLTRIMTKILHRCPFCRRGSPTGRSQHSLVR